MLGVHREHRRQRLPAEAQLDVRVVLEDQEVVLGGQREQRLALGQRERVAGGVLEVGDDVGELRAHGLRALQQPASASVSIPSGSSSTAWIFAPRSRSESSVRSYVGRSTITSSPRAHELLEQERVGLHRAVGHEHALGLDAVAVGDPGAQPRIADRGAVGGRAGRVALERAHGRVAQALDVDDVERGRAARE